jgi:hypothetical protein
MGRATGVALGVPVLAAGIGGGCGAPASEAVARECFSIWENVIPEGAEPGGFDAVGRAPRVRYRHPGGTGEVAV